jgi:hypothetical protein
MPRFAPPVPAQERQQHAARKLLEKYGVGKDTLADRFLGSAAFGQNAVMVSSPDGKQKHMVWATKDAGLEDVASGLLKRSGISKPTPDDLDGMLEQLRSAGGDRDDAALLDQMRVQQKLASQGRFQRIEAVESVMDEMKQNEAMRAELAPYFGFVPESEPAPIGKPPAPEAAPEAAPVPQNAAVPPPTGAGAIKPEADDWWSASQPELKGIPVLDGMPRWGLAALGGTTIGGSALAYHLLAGGQQQSNYGDYAAAAQAMAAY